MLAPLKACGLLLSPLAVSLTLMAKDRQANCNCVSSETQDLINQGLFWERAARFAMPGLGPDRIQEALDWIQKTCPDTDIIQAHGFNGEVSVLCPNKIQDPDRIIIKKPCLPDGTLYLAAMKREISPFTAAYNSPASLLAEYQNSIGSRWPDYFPWWEHLVEVYGIYHM